LIPFFNFAPWADWVYFSPDGFQLATFAGQDSTLYFWDAINLGNTPPRAIPWFDHAGPVANVTISPNWQTLAWVSRGTLQLMDCTATPLMEPPQFADFISQIEFTPNSQTLLVLAAETISDQYTSVVISYDARTGTRLHTIAFDEFARNFVIGPDGQTLAISSDSGITFWNVVTGKEVASFISLASIAQILAISPDGSILASANDQGDINLFTIDSGMLLGTLPGDPGINRLTFRREGKVLVAEYFDGKIQFWGVKE
jgi:dipeptidyl aminopeptidase/acylaminoacyl peptidase